MTELKDYSNFVFSAYLIFMLILLVFGLFSFIKFKSNSKKLAHLKNDLKNDGFK